MNGWKVSTLVLGSALVATLAYGSIRSAHAEPQPHMQAALSLLEQAKAQLQAATADKGGHRVEAIKATERAIEQTKKGIEFDNKH